MLPTREEALKLIRDGLLFNPGPWGEHCLTAAHCAEKIASAWGKRPCHQICLYYNVHLIDDNIPLDGLFHGYDELDNERIDLDFCWVSLKDLKKGTKVYPLELIPYILESGKEIVHFVSKQI